MIYKFFDGTELTNDREELNKWKEENELETKLENLYLNYLNTKSVHYTILQIKRC